MMKLTNCLGLLAGVGLFPVVVQAQPAFTPVSADRFEVGYYVTDAEGERVRRMDAEDHERFLNKARCECGQQIQTQVRLKKPEDENYDLTKLVQTFLGPMCATAEEDPFGEHGRCVQLAAQPIQGYIIGVVRDAHPVWLTAGIADGSDGRDPEEAFAAGSCDGSGVAGVWMCVQTDTTAGCQAEEFFLSSDAAQAEGEPAPLLYDFEAPAILLRDLEVEAFSDGAVLSWQLGSQGGLAGFRVLCEEAGSGAAPAGVDIAAPDITAASDGEHYFNAHNLCAGEPFSTVNHPERPAGDCGDGVVDPGEQCDDGEDNREGGLCDDACELGVGAGLHALDWGHVCSAHVAWDEGSAVVRGLESGKTYNLVLVGYDANGNPRAVPWALQVTPDAELPALPAEDTEGCGCRTTPAPWGWLMVLAGLGLVRRRR